MKIPSKHKVIFHYIYKAMIPILFGFSKFLKYDMKMTCKELAEILLKTPDHSVTVSIDDGYGMQCDAEIDKVEVLNSETVSIIPEQPVDIYSGDD